MTRPQLRSPPAASPLPAAWRRRPLRAPSGRSTDPDLHRRLPARLPATAASRRCCRGLAARGRARRRCGRRSRPRPSPTTTPWSPACGPTATASSTTPWRTRRSPGVTLQDVATRPRCTDARWWDEGEPIWVAAERAGIVTATDVLAGLRGADPRRAAHATGGRSTRPSPPDAAGRPGAGLAGPAAGRAARLPDALLRRRRHRRPPRRAGLRRRSTRRWPRRWTPPSARLIAGLKARGLAANLVVVADHGMAPVSPDRRIFLDDLLPKDAYRALTGGAFMTHLPGRRPRGRGGRRPAGGPRALPVLAQGGDPGALPLRPATRASPPYRLPARDRLA